MTLRPGRGDHPQQLLGRGGERLHAHHQRVAQRLGQGVPVAVGGGCQQLLGEERVAAGALEEGVGDRARGVRAEDPEQLGAQLEPRERLDLEAPDPLEALHVGEERPQRVAAVQLVRAVGRDQHEPLAPRGAQQEREEVAGRAVGPVEVLDDEHERRLVGHAPEQRQQHLEQARLGELRVAGGGGHPGLGQQPGQLGATLAGQLDHRLRAQLALQLPQRADDRGVGQLALAQLDAVAGQDARPGRASALRVLGRQAALADARLARHQQGARLFRGRARQGMVEGGQLLGSADESRARYPPHAAIIHRARSQLRRRHGVRGAGAAARGAACAATCQCRAGCARRPHAARLGARPPRRM